MYSLHNYCTYSISKLLQGIIYPVSHRKIVTVRNISRYIGQYTVGGCTVGRYTVVCAL